jgi:formylglycine-generating enzyme required for sulfatase activity
MAGIFISYRRDDSAAYAGRLYDRLSQHFGRDHLFMDIDTIKPGQNFVAVIEENVGSCTVLIALIGRLWLTLTTTTGQRRLDHLEDFVRLEIAAAIDRNILVIPVLVGGGVMPRATDLPNILQAIAHRNAIEVSDTRFHYDVDRLIEALESVLFEPEMIRIPAGEFLMGSDLQKDKEANAEEQPQHSLYLSDYCLAKTPVTNAQYTAFVRATGYDQPAEWMDGKPLRGKENHPVVFVSWVDAAAYCRWLSQNTGKSYRLPSEAEWEKGARGTDGHIYPWGNQWDAPRCNFDKGFRGDTTPVGAYPEGASPYGLLDMAGNVWEWTRSLWGENPENPVFPYPYNPEDGRENPNASQSVRRVLRGGAFWNDLRLVRCASRYRLHPNDRSWNWGFRVTMTMLP